MDREEPTGLLEKEQRSHIVQGLPRSSANRSTHYSETRSATLPGLILEQKRLEEIKRLLSSFEGSVDQKLAAIPERTSHNKFQHML